MIVGTVRESFPGERRVAIVPATVKMLHAKGVEVVVERGCGAGADFADSAYEAEGARVVGARGDVFGAADIVVQVRTHGANPREGAADLESYRRGNGGGGGNGGNVEQVIVGLCEPLTAAGPLEAMARGGVRVHAMELMPRTTKAQVMDALSSQAMIAGYKAALLAASTLPRLFPLMMTAAGTATAARVLVIGAGVAGLQAIATARRLGAQVTGYDVRPAVKEEVLSLGAKFLELKLPDDGGGDGRGGYASSRDERFYKAQQEMMAEGVAHSDVVITTAAVPGKKSPVLITRSMVEGMRAGSVVVDLAAERGGNCEVTSADETVVHAGVTVLGPTNLPSTVAGHASFFYARNLAAFVLHMLKDSAWRRDDADEIGRETLLATGGRVVHRRVREVLGIGDEGSGAAGRPTC